MARSTTRGIGHAVKRLHDVSTSECDRLHSTDLRGVFFGMQAEINHFLATGGGVIVNTASTAGLKAILSQGAYVAAKHGVVGLTRQAVIEYVKDGIRVAVVAPGLVATPQFRCFPEENQKMSRHTSPVAVRPSQKRPPTSWRSSCRTRPRSSAKTSSSSTTP